MKRLIALMVLVAAGAFYFHESPARWRGMPAAADPVQSDKALPVPFEHAGYTITPLAHYQITAVVLNRERYRFDRNADLSPLDLALGWGPMSVAPVLNDLSISQSGRWYHYHWSNEPPLDPDLIINHSANTHCLPADDQVRRQLLAVRRHDVVTLEGYLVEARAADGWHWRSSLSRSDSGANSCEVLWVTAVSDRQP